MEDVEVTLFEDGHRPFQSQPVRRPPAREPEPEPPPVGHPVLPLVGLDRKDVNSQ